MDGRSRLSRRWTTGARLALGIHVAVVCLVGAYIAASAVTGAVGANIGLGLGLLGLALLGAPWSLLILVDQQFTVDSPAFIALAAGGALLNLVLHAAAWARWGAHLRRV